MTASQRSWWALPCRRRASARSRAEEKCSPVAVAAPRVGVAVEQRVAVLGDGPEQQPVDDAQQVLVHVVEA